MPGTAVQLDDDVIIATEDGQIPPTTTEPPVDPDGPDAPPTVDASPTTAVPVPLARSGRRRADRVDVADSH